MAKKKQRGQFEIYRGVDNEMRARLRAGNGEIVASGEGYKGRRAVERFIEILKSCADLPVVDLTFHKTPKPKKAKPDPPPQLPTMMGEGNDR